MKRAEQLSHFTKLSPADLQKEIRAIEAKLQAAKMAMAFGKSKQVRDLRNLRRRLARALTIGNQKVRTVSQKAEEK